MYRLNRRVLLSLCLLLASGYAASVEHEKQAAQGTNADQSLTTRVEAAFACRSGAQGGEQRLGRSLGRRDHVEWVSRKDGAGRTRCSGSP